ncbi:acyl carrier protein [Streptomyces eurocidicus]|uniref:Acyl carrier protein n=1 Tax=Streptomyces eurocidicus TaxID=66423 RepID=A0A2N8NT56_STREU|nr:acyl carrier protein [Streptomyces eurocidicus]MBB5119235.1 acyl carrier protein [Streptomyces eurocidicus]MBF6053177.1 acyl carrier protein [Streptomyces eurocidicus]PNE31951.1 acyl carrier protein [Streptomyces eurocidicus]
MDRTDRIRQFIEDRFLVEFGGEVTDGSDLFKAGVMDSFGYIQLMGFLEEEFSIAVTDEEILTDVFVSLDAIDAFVARKLSGGAAGRGDASCAG